MKDNKSRDIFYAVVAIATLVVALIGATLAYFSMTATSGEGAVGAQAAVISVDYEDGQSILTSASKLIPIAYSDMATIYEGNLSSLNSKYQDYLDIIDDPDATPEEKETALAGLNHATICQDTQHPGQGYEVCSVYRFSVSNPTSATIKGTLRTESNGFTNLAFAVRDVTSGTWIDVDTDATPKYKKLEKCDAASCVTDSVYAALAKNSIFGYDNGDYVTKTIANSRQTYDVVLFIDETFAAQDEDQGQTFAGNLLIESTGGEKISGSMIP